MLKVVSNTTPIISLLKIGKLQIFKDLYQEICIPEEVFKEIEAGKVTIQPNRERSFLYSWQIEY